MFIYIYPWPVASKHQFMVSRLANHSLRLSSILVATIRGNRFQRLVLILWFILYQTHFHSLCCGLYICAQMNLESATCLSRNFTITREKPRCTTSTIPFSCSRYVYSFL